MLRHNGQVTYQALEDMTYLDCILQESLRMYPPLPYLTRICVSNYLIPGTKVNIEAGTKVMIPIHSIQNDPAYVQDPSTFNPERFKGETLQNLPFYQMPFGEGPRKCIGMRFGRIQAKLGLLSVLRKFEVSSSTRKPLSWDPRGRVPSLLIHDPDLIKNIIVKDFSHFTDHGLKFSEDADPLLARNLFNIRGQHWKNMRTKLTPVFTSGRMKTMFPMVLKCAQNLEAFLENVAGSTGDIELKTANLIKGTFHKPECQMYFRSLINDIITSRDASGETRKDFLQLLIDLKERGHLNNDDVQLPENETAANDSNIDRKKIYCKFLTFWSRQHIEEVLQRHNGELTYQALHDMTYLDWILQETLRKYPPIAIFRECTKKYTIPGSDVTIEEGTPLIIPNYGLHYDPKFFPDPEDFKPERFSDAEMVKKNQYIYLPFGEGPRLCIGKRFAYMQSKLGLLTFLRKFEVQANAKTVTSLSTFNYWRDKGVVFLKPYPLVGSMWKQITLQEHVSELFRRIYFDYPDQPYVGFYQVSEDADPLVARNLFNIRGQNWKYMRTKLAPVFTSGRMKAMFPMVLQCATNLEAFLENVAQSTGEVELKDILARYTTDVIASNVFGITCDSINEPSNTFRLMSKKMLETDVIQGLRVAIITYIPGLANKVRATFFKPECEVYFRDLVNDIIKSRAASGDIKKDFLQLLIELMDKGKLNNEDEKQPGKEDLIENNIIEKITYTDVLAQASVFLFAGFETSSSAMTFALFELARRPDLQRTARQHIEEVLQRHDGELTYQALHDMTYLDWILQETLRKYPSLAIFRECTKKYTIPGSDVTIEEGTPLIIPNYGLHYDPKFFPDPEKFIPERFSDAEMVKENQYIYLPFGEGPRLCIGKRFAYIQSKLGLLTFLRKFEVQANSKTVKMIAMILGLATVALTLAYFYFTSTFNYWRDKGVVFVKPYPLVGSMWKQLSLQEHMSEFFHRVYFEYPDQPYVGFFQGLVPSLLIRDEKLIKNIITSDFSHFTDHSIKFSEEADPVFAKNLFGSRGQHWKELRAKLAPTFTSGRMKVMFPLVLECAKTFEAYLLENADQEMTELKDLLARYTTNVIASSIFGVPCDALNDPNNVFRQTSKKMLETDFIQGIKLAIMTNYPGMGNVVRASLLKPECDAYFRTVVNDIINFRAKSKIRCKDFIQLLIDLKEKGRLDEEEGQGHNDEQIRVDDNHADIKFTDTDVLAQAITFFFAGFETSSSAMTFALVELARHPELQLKARCHIEEVLQRHGGQITYEVLQDMTYLDWILKEILRKYPPIAIFRECTKNYRVPGTNLTIETGTPIIIPNYALHRDPQFFYDPDKFIPERFSDAEMMKENQYIYLPFGEGPRICIGKRFASMQSKLGLMTILRKFEVHLSPKTKYPLTWDPRFFPLTSKYDINVQFSRL
ncbi:hypothetical protein B566_EDAN007687 [Ephemera danica]|nr:hypothetical protein B566_EDAN007687 [Ephemera danica]